MSQRITKVKKKLANGYTEAIPIGAKAKDIIMQNGTILQDVVEILQTGSAGHESLTQAEYNALPQLEKNNGTVYFITDNPDSGGVASAAVTYNNSNVQTSVTNVQSAIDELYGDKVNYTDIINNLTSTNGSVPLSAAQGKILQDQVTNLFTNSAVLNNGTRIPEEADLNDYTTPGVYYAPDSSVTATLSNTPLTNSGFKLIVMRCGYSGTSYLMQLFIRSTSITITSSIWARITNNSGVWQDWTLLTLTDMNSLFIYANTYDQLYKLCQRLPINTTATFNMLASAAKAISDNRIDASFKGIVSRTSANVYDFFGMLGAGDSIWTIRTTLAQSGATVQYIRRTIACSTAAPLIKRVTYTAAYSGLAANSNKTLTADDFDISTPSGYLPLSVSYVTSGVGGVIVRFYAITNTKTTLSKSIMDLRNVSSSSQSGTAAITINYIRSEAING